MRRGACKQGETGRGAASGSFGEARGGSFLRSGIVSAGAALLALSAARDAAACGGCFHEPVRMGGSQSEATQVTGHRMIFSIHQGSTSLWDQIEYAGDPESFAWVLPIKGTVELGLSSDALFQALEQATAVTVTVEYTCIYYCESDGEGTGGGSSGGDVYGTAGGPGGPVTILDQSVVGPYETVQIASGDPQAITDWLTSHGYAIPDDIQPIVDAYVQDGFGFLALKLVPGEGVQSMRPVRVTIPGASTVLPLRMVAAGTGAVTPVKLWVVGDGRYQPQNFPAFVFDDSDLQWNYATESSNYATQVSTQLAAQDGFGWAVEGSIDLAGANLASPITASAEGLASYSDENGQNAEANLGADMTALFGANPAGQVQRVTRMFAQLSREALANDLILGASSDQSEVPLEHHIVDYFEWGGGPCPPEYTVCGSGNGAGTGGDGAGGGAPGGEGGHGGSGPSPGCTCATGGATPEWPAPALMTGLLVIMPIRRLRRRAPSSRTGDGQHP